MPFIGENLEHSNLLIRPHLTKECVFTVYFQMLSQQVECLGLSNNQAMLTRFQEAFRTMWTQNGDHISRMYLGTGALDGKARVC